MTEVRSNYEYDGESQRHLFATTPMDAAIRYTPSPDVLNAIQDVFNDRGEIVLAKKGLLLSSRAMRFQNTHDLQAFNAKFIAPKIRLGADLSRVDFEPKSTWEETESLLGPAYRVYLHADQQQGVALNALYHHYLEVRGSNPLLPNYLQEIERKTPQAVPRNGHDHISSRALSFNIPRSLTDHQAKDGAAALSERLNTVVKKGGLLYAIAPKIRDEPSRHSDGPSLLQ